MGYSEEKIEKANETDLVGFCKYKGIELSYEGDGNYRIPGNAGLIIKDNYYNHFGCADGGDAIKFCKEYLHLPFYKAVGQLLAYQRNHTNESGTHAFGMSSGLEGKNSEKVSTSRSNNKLELPQKANSNYDVFHYLVEKRNIEEKLVNDILREELLYQDTRNNCVFICRDKLGQPHGAILRGILDGSSFKGNANGTDSSYGWVLPSVKGEKKKSVIIAEAPIDTLSIISYYPDKEMRNMHYLAMGGVKINTVRKYLEENPYIEELILSVDNDDAGNKFFEEAKDEFEDKYKITEFRAKYLKDWNEALILKPWLS